MHVHHYNVDVGLGKVKKETNKQKNKTKQNKTKQNTTAK